MIAAPAFDQTIDTDQTNTVNLNKPGTSVLVEGGVIIEAGNAPAMVSNAGDTWVIANRGVIRSSNDIALWLGGSGTVLNEHVISGATWGIWGAGDLRVRNSAGALIQGLTGVGGTGVLQLDNAGAIDGGRYGVYYSLPHSGEGVTIINSGELVGGAAGIYLITGSASSVSNVIHNQAGGKIRAHLPTGHGISVLHGTSTVVNDAGASIEGAHSGIIGMDLFTDLKVINAGTITGGTGSGIWSYGGGSMTNLPGGYIGGAGGVAYVRSRFNTENVLRNAGTIEGKGTDFVAGNGPDAGSGAGVYIGAVHVPTGTFIHNALGGVIQGNVYGIYSGPAAMDSDAGPVNVSNAGTISGQTGISFNGGNGTVVNTGLIIGLGGTAITFDAIKELSNTLSLDAGSSLVGNVVGGAGTNTLILKGANTEDLSRFQNMQFLSMEGESWTLQGSGSFTTGASVANGNMFVDGRLTTPLLTVHAEGTLSGSGTIVGDVVNHGTLAPGSLGQQASTLSRGDSTIGTTLTVDGDYIGNGGTLTMNTQLGNDTSPTDKLVVTGNMSGNTFVAVKNAGGFGAVTDNGILLVSVGGASDGTFQLQGRAVAGLYDYQLYKGGKATPGDGGWYLRSELPPAPPSIPPAPPTDPLAPPTDPEIVDPPASPVPPVTPALRPEPAAYLGNQNTALRMFQHTMHDRVGEPGLIARDDGGQGYAAWVRVQTRNLDAGTVGGQIDIDTNANVVQMGVEKQFPVGEGRLYAGVMGGYGRATTDAISNFTDHKSRGEVKGINLGIYGTWIRDTGGSESLYVDTWAQYGRFDNTVKGDYLGRERYDSHAWSGSVEAGYALPLHKGEQSGLYLEPQAQVIYTDFRSDEVIESNGTVVQTRKAGGTTIRLGARLYSRPTSTRYNRVQPFVAVNWWSGGNASTIAMDGERLSRDLPKNTYEAKVGAQLELGQGWSGWGQLGYQQGSQGYRDVNGQLGVKLSW